MKTCNKCNIEKPLTEFGKDKKAKDGYKYSCKRCNKAYQEANKEKLKAYHKAHYEANKDKIKDREKAYREANKDKIKDRQKAYREANKDKINEFQKAYYKANKDKIKDRKKAYREANKDKIAESNKKWYKANKERVKEYGKAYYKANKDKVLKRLIAYDNKRRKEDVIYKLRCNLRNRIYIAIKNKGYSKNTKTSDTLGCTWEFLKKYLESQFTKGMSWDNYGEWHLDHIYPVSLAKNEEELIKLNHYTNFQPLWAEDNLKKSNKIENGKQIKLL